MKMMQARREANATIIADMVKLFDDSGVEYTCLAAIINVIKPTVESRCAALPELALRPRYIINQVCDTIHRRKYPKN